MNKKTTNELKSIRTSFFKKYNLYQDYRSGQLLWRYNNGSSESIGFEVSIKDLFVRIFYYVIDLASRSKKHDYRINLVSTACFFGGYRYWFQCPLINCKKRVGVLYFNGGVLGCRHCHNLTYVSRNLGGVRKLLGNAPSIGELDKMLSSLKRIHYRGKPTKKYLRYLKKEKHSDLCILGMSIWLNGSDDFTVMG